MKKLVFLTAAKETKIISMSSGASDNTCFNLMLSYSSNIYKCCFSKQINLVQNEQFSFFPNSRFQKKKKKCQQRVTPNVI